MPYEDHGKHSGGAGNKTELKQAGRIYGPGNRFPEGKRFFCLHNQEKNKKEKNSFSLYEFTKKQKETEENDIIRGEGVDILHLSGIIIDNYRTFRHVEFTFDRRANYIVGDNNIGKSNFLEMLETLYSGYGFREEDFQNPDQPIQVRFTLSVEDRGKAEEIHIRLFQKITELAPSLENEEDHTPLPLESLRSLCYISHSLEDFPRKTLMSDELEEVIHIFSRYLSCGDDLCRESAELLGHMGIHTDLSGDPQAAALRLIYDIYGSDSQTARPLQDGVRIMLAAGIHLILELSRRKESRAFPFSDIVLTDSGGRKILPVMVSIDEPELHLHPYLQRAVLSYYRRILRNEEPFFLHVARKILEIDGLEGQLFVVTHSTDALVNDYRQIIRLYWDSEGQIQAACGSSFRFDGELEKHLIMHFPEVKEALYSRCAILVEGETEYGAFSWFAKTLHVHFDYHGICLINARGESSIPKIAQLLRRFVIPSVCLYDRDVKGNKKETKQIFYTENICFEMDVVRSCIEKGRRAVLDEAIRDISDMDPLVTSSMVKKACLKLDISRQKHPPRKLKHISGRDVKALIFYYFAWFYSNKGVISGRALGLRLEAGDIPKAFRNVICAAASLAEHSEKVNE